MPRKLLKIEGSIAENSFTLVDKDFQGDVSELTGDVIVPLSYWAENKEAIKTRPESTGIWLDAEETAQAIKDDLNDVALVAINFPKFVDGRGYSTSRLLRERYGYEGEIRAIGDVLLDQLHFMKRCGISTFEVVEEKDIAKALNLLNTFSESYQVAFDQLQPLFRRREGSS